MSRVEVERGRRYYCEVVDADTPLAGTFVVGDQGVRASLVRFDAFLPPEVMGSLHLRTEGNWYASMFDLVPSGWSQVGVEKRTAYVQNTSSNVTLVGWDVWTNDDLIRRLRFRIPGIDCLFESSLHFKSIINSAMTDMPDMTAFKIDAATASVKAWLAPSGNLSSERPREVVPWIDIEFLDGRSLVELQRFIPRVLRFFSTVSGKNLHAAEIIVSRYTEEEFARRIEAQLPAPEHRVFRYVDATERTSEKADPYNTLVSLWSAEDRAVLEASLDAWIERDEVWAPAAAMMADSLSKQGVMSASRLLSATRCLEEIPGTEPEKVISKVDANALGKVIDRAARQLGYAGIGGRFRNAISKVALETNRERLTRLVRGIRDVFGDTVVDEHIVDWVAEALSMRGRAAHGTCTAIDDEFEVFARAVEAVECLNLLLIVKDLPLGKEHRARALRHPLVQQYRNCTLPGSPKTFRTRLHELASTGRSAS